MNIQSTAEEQFQNIVAASEQEALHDIDNAIVDELLEESDGPDVADTGTQVSITSSEPNTSSSNLSSPEVPANIPEPTSESTSSIEIIAPIEVLAEPPQRPEFSDTMQQAAQVPEGPSLQLPTSANPPANPQTNVATIYDQDLREDKDRSNSAGIIK